MQKLMLALSCALALGGLSACQSAQQEVYGGAAILTTLEQAATVYAKWPECGSVGATALCSKQSVKDAIAEADQAAYNAVTEAMGIVDDPNAGSDAVSVAVNSATVALAALAAVIPDTAEKIVNGGDVVEVQ